MIGLDKIRPRTERELYVKNHCMFLLKKFGDNPKEHGYQLAMFVAQEMQDDYKPTIFSGSKPDILSEYEALGEMDKLAWDKKYPEWRRQPNVQNYFSEISSVESSNESTKSFLKDSQEALDKTSNKVEYEKLGSMLAEYQVPDRRVPQVDWQN